MNRLVASYLCLGHQKYETRIFQTDRQKTSKLVHITRTHDQHGPQMSGTRDVTVEKKTKKMVRLFYCSFLLLFFFFFRPPVNYRLKKTFVSRAATYVSSISMFANI